MRLVVVETEGSAEFGRAVLDPLRTSYPELILLSLDQAARRFVLSKRGPPACDRVVTLTGDVRVDRQPRTVAEIEDLADLAQGAGTYVSVDAERGLVRGIYALPDRDGRGASGGRIRVFRGGVTDTDQY